MSPTAPPQSRSTRWIAGFRPAWHKGVGALFLVGGIGLFIVCQLNIWHVHDHGGHIWYLVGMATAAASTWWFGLFDNLTPSNKKS